MMPPVLVIKGKDGLHFEVRVVAPGHEQWYRRFLGEFKRHFEDYCPCYGFGEVFKLMGINRTCQVVDAD
jgi:hypothetical protein